MQAVLNVPEVTVGLDLGDRKSALCRLDASGKVVEHKVISTTAAALGTWFGGLPRARVILEASPHSPWVSRLLSEWGHESIVANPAALRRRNHLKTDRVDAEALARWGRIDPTVLAPIQHRELQAHADLELLKARDALVRSRTLLINHVRGSVQSFGVRLSACSSPSFARTVEREIPATLRPALNPLLELVASMTQQIRAYDREIEQLNEHRYPETQLLQQVAGVGPVTSLCYAPVIEDPARFPDSRSVGAYLGLVPRKEDSSAYRFVLIRFPSLVLGDCDGP